MTIRKFLVFKKSIAFAGMLLGMSLGALSGPADAVSTTGQVGYYFVQDYGGGQTYAFVNIGPGSMVCYHIGTSTTAAYATIFASKQIAGKAVTVSCDNNFIITQVAQ